jgi:cell division protein FtsA
MKELDDRHIVAIDLGSSAIRLCVAHVLQDELQVEYYREADSEGIRSSIIYNPQLVAGTVGAMVREAEEAFMGKITQVVVGMPRKDVVELTASMSVTRSAPDDYITREEIRNLKELALDSYPLPSPEKHEIYGAVAQAYEIDGGLILTERNVVGTISPTLEGRFRVFVGRRQATVALDKVFNSLGVVVARRFFTPETTASAVLTDVEKSGGVALVDIGGGVTSVSIFQGGILRHYASIPFGGKSVTGDIQTECSLSEDLAESIKRKFGGCLPDKLGPLSEKVLDIRVADPPMELPVRYLSEIVGSRYREIVDAVLYLIQESGLMDSLRCGIVLTGGGSEQAHLLTMFKERSGYRVRMGKPRNLFTSAVGKDVFSTMSANILGMVLAACDIPNLDCLATSEAPAAATPETSPAVDGETALAPEPEPEGDGLLFKPEEFGEPVTPPGGKKGGNKGRSKEKGKGPQKPSGFLSSLWTTIEDKAIRWYDRFNEDETKPDLSPF